MREIKIYKMAIFFLLLTVFCLLFLTFLPSFITPSLFLLPKLSTVGYVQPSISIEVEKDKGIVNFRHKCYEVSMVVDKDQAISIQDGINRIVRGRPNAHDLLNNMLRTFNVRVLMVKIEKLERLEGSNTSAFFAKIFLESGTTLLELDSRPSDALAIAARTDYEVPIYFNQSLMETVGKKIC